MSLFAAYQANDFGRFEELLKFLEPDPLINDGHLSTLEDICYHWVEDKSDQYVALLLKHGANPNRNDNGFHPLRQMVKHFSIPYSRGRPGPRSAALPKIARLLLEHGAFCKFKPGDLGDIKLSKDKQAPVIVQLFQEYSLCEAGPGPQQQAHQRRQETLAKCAVIQKQVAIQRQVEMQRQAEQQVKTQQEVEAKRQAEIQRQAQEQAIRQAEVQKLAEIQRLAQIEAQRQAAVTQKQAEAEKLAEAERLAEIQRQAEWQEAQPFRNAVESTRALLQNLSEPSVDKSNRAVIVGVAEGLYDLTWIIREGFKHVKDCSTLIRDALSHSGADDERKEEVLAANSRINERWETMEQIVSTITQLMYDVAIISAVHLSNSTMNALPSYDFMNMMMLQDILNIQPELYTEAVSRMNSRERELSQVVADFQQLDSHAQTQLIARLATNLAAPGILTRASKTVYSHRLNFFPRLEGQKNLFKNRFPNEVRQPPASIEFLSGEQLINSRNRYVHLGRTDIADAIWVIDEHGKLLVASRLKQGIKLTGDYKYHLEKGEFISHSALTQGRPVRAAGEIWLHITEAGQVGIKLIDNRSGHFRPRFQNMTRDIEDAFINAGFDARGKFVNQYPNDPMPFVPFIQMPAPADFIPTVKEVVKGAAMVGGRYVGGISPRSYRREIERLEEDRGIKIRMMIDSKVDFGSEISFGIFLDKHKKSDLQSFAEAIERKRSEVNAKKLEVQSKQAARQAKQDAAGMAYQAKFGQNNSELANIRGENSKTKGEETLERLRGISSSIRGGNSWADKETSAKKKVTQEESGPSMVNGRYVGGMSPRSFRRKIEELEEERVKKIRMMIESKIDFGSSPGIFYGNHRELDEASFKKQMEAYASEQAARARERQMRIDEQKAKQSIAMMENAAEMQRRKALFAGISSSRTVRNSRRRSGPTASSADHRTTNKSSAAVNNQRRKSGGETEYVSYYYDLTPISCYGN